MKTIHHVLDIDAPATRVWDALTEPGPIAGWWSTQVKAPSPAVGAQAHWTFGGDFNPVMEITRLDADYDDGDREVDWQCVSGHQPWQDSIFRFRIFRFRLSEPGAPGSPGNGGGGTRLRFWQEYAVELADDYYGVYNYNWGYYLESLRLFCSTGTGKPFAARAG